MDMCRFNIIFYAEKYKKRAAQFQNTFFTFTIFNLKPTSENICFLDAK